MRSTSSLFYNVTGQTLAFRAMEGRPTSGTVSVFFDFAGDDGTALWTATATVDSVSTTLTATSGLGQSDPSLINVSPTGIITGRKYLLAENSVQEWISPVKVSAASVTARHLLKNIYTTAATLVSTVMTVTVDATFIANILYISDQADPNPTYRVRWTYVVSGVTYVQYSFFDVVRSKIGPHVDIDDLDARAPGIADALATDDATEQGRPLIDAAWQAVQADCASLGLDTDAIHNDQILDELVLLRSLSMWAMTGQHPTGIDAGSYIALTTTAYNRFLEQHFKAVQSSNLARGTTGAAETVIATPYWGK